MKIHSRFIARPLNRFTHVESIQPGFQVLSNGHESIQRTRFNGFKFNRRRPLGKYSIERPQSPPTRPAWTLRRWILGVPVYPRQSNLRRSKPERCTRAYYGLDDFYAARQASVEISACNRVEVIQDQGTCFELSE